MSFTVVTDSAGNLPNEIVESHKLIVIPLVYHFRNQDLTCTDISKFDGDDFYAKLKSGEVATTSQITPTNYTDVFQPILAAGHDIIYVSMASGISGTFNSANIAAAILKEQYPERKIGVIDTKGAALGEDFVAMRAAKLRDEGTDFETAVKYLNDYSKRLCNVFTVEDLLFLRRSGRLSNIASIVGTILNVKPMLKGSMEAKIVSFDKVRGRRKSIEILAHKYEALVRSPETQTIGIVHAACPQDADKLIKLISESSKPPKDIMCVGYEPVTGSHVGPGALALFFEGDENVRFAVDKA